MGEGRGLTTKVYTVCVCGGGGRELLDTIREYKNDLHVASFFSPFVPPADGRIRHQRNQSDHHQHEANSTHSIATSST